MKISAVFVALAAPDDQPLVAFYQALFDQAPQLWQPGRYAEFDLPGLKLGIFCPQSDHQPEFFGPDRPRCGSLSLCLEVEPLEAAIERLRAIGYPPTAPISQTSHGRELYAYDPAGNRLILHEANRAA
jgi:predicted enzyme related to lactoylglutathione lyase